MNNPFKNNSLAAGLFGYVIGVFTLLGGQAIVGNCNGRNASNGGSSSVSSLFQPAEVDDSFHGLEQNDDGDVIITKSGNCFHSDYGCPALNRSRETRTVNRDDAEGKGMKPCSKCCTY